MIYPHQKDIQLPTLRLAPLLQSQIKISSHHDAPIDLVIRALLQESRHLPLKGAYLTGSAVTHTCVNSDVPYNDIDFRLVFQKGSEFSKIDAAVKRALGGNSSSFLRTTKYIQQPNSYSFCGYSLAGIEGCPPLDITVQITDSPGLPSVFNLDSFYVDLNNIGQEMLILSSTQGDCERAFNEVQAGVLSCLNPSQIQKFGWGRYLLALTMGFACPDPYLSDLLLAKEGEKEQEVLYAMHQFLQRKRDPSFWPFFLANALFHTPKTHSLHAALQKQLILCLERNELGGQPVANEALELFFSLFLPLWADDVRELEHRQGLWLRCTKDNRSILVPNTPPLGTKERLEGLLDLQRSGALVSIPLCLARKLKEERPKWEREALIQPTLIPLLESLVPDYWSSSFLTQALQNNPITLLSTTTPNDRCITRLTKTFTDIALHESAKFLLSTLPSFLPILNKEDLSRLASHLSLTLWHELFLENTTSSHQEALLSLLDEIATEALKKEDEAILLQLVNLQKNKTFFTPSLRKTYLRVSLFLLDRFPSQKMWLEVFYASRSPSLPLDEAQIGIRACLQHLPTFLVELNKQDLSSFLGLVSSLSDLSSLSPKQWKLLTEAIGNLENNPLAQQDLQHLARALSLLPEAQRTHNPFVAQCSNALIEYFLLQRDDLEQEIFLLLSSIHKRRLTLETSDRLIDLQTYLLSLEKQKEGDLDGQLLCHSIACHPKKKSLTTQLVHALSIRARDSLSWGLLGLHLLGQNREKLPISSEERKHAQYLLTTTWGHVQKHQRFFLSFFLEFIWVIETQLFSPPLVRNILTQGAISLRTPQSLCVLTMLSYRLWTEKQYDIPLTLVFNCLDALFSHADEQTLKEALTRLLRTTLQTHSLQEVLVRQLAEKLREKRSLSLPEAYLSLLGEHLNAEEVSQVLPWIPSKTWSSEQKHCLERLANAQRK